MELVRSRTIEQTSALAHRIASYLGHQYDPVNGFNGHTHYGEAYVFALWSRTTGFQDRIPGLLRTIQLRKDKFGHSCAWEFFAHGLLNGRAEMHDSQIRQILGDGRPSGNKVTNYILLRALAAVRLKRNALCACMKAIWYCLRVPNSGFRACWHSAGLLQDSCEDLSFQYHAVSMLFLFELYALTQFKFFKKRAVSAAEFCLCAMMPNGDYSYVGRGQEQSFGYGALIAGLAYAYIATGRMEFLSALNAALNFVLAKEIEPGCIPLVLNEISERLPEDHQNVTLPMNLGWYPYNNFLDYLPFIGYCCSLASEVLQKPIQGKANKSCGPVSRDGILFSDQQFVFAKYSDTKYGLCAPTRSWTSNLAFPYLCLRNESVFPCYGGEQHQASIYNTTALPLPLFANVENEVETSFQDILFYHFQNKFSLIGKGKGVFHRREFTFAQRGFDLLDTAKIGRANWSQRLLCWNYLFFSVESKSEQEFVIKGWGRQRIRLRSSLDLKIVEGPLYCARGPLVALRCYKRMTDGLQQIRLRFSW